jgi:transposase
MRSLARRIQLLDPEVDEHDRELKRLLDQAAPQLIAERGIGYITAAQFYIAWSHSGRCHSEAAFARLGGTSPVPATSGQNQTRRRLNRGGDRQLNRALYLVAVTKQPARSRRPRSASVPAGHTSASAATSLVARSR